MNGLCTHTTALLEHFATSAHLRTRQRIPRCAEFLPQIGSICSSPGALLKICLKRSPTALISDVHRRGRRMDGHEYVAAEEVSLRGDSINQVAFPN